MSALKVSRHSVVSKPQGGHGGGIVCPARRIKPQLWISLFLIAVVCPAFSQGVKVGYDKTVNFSRYKSYTIPEPSTPPTRPVLYSTVMGAIYNELKAKHFEALNSGGDLVLICTGGVEFGIATAAGTPILPTYGGSPLSINATMWTGAAGPSNLMAIYVPEGNLMLTFVDPNTRTIVWSGTVSEKLDIEHKSDSLKRVEKAISKLLKKFPPKNN